MTLSRFLYISNAKVYFTDGDLQRLRDAGLWWNARCGVTGLLLHDGDRFTQYIEGEQDGLAEIRNRIVADARHYDIVSLGEGAIERRQFEGWALKAHWRLRGTRSLVFVDEVRAAVGNVTDAELRAYLLGFASLA